MTNQEPKTGAERLTSDALAIYDVADTLEMSGEKNLAAFLRTKLDSILTFAYSLSKESKSQELIDDVISYMKGDIKTHDIEALEELLYFAPKENLIAYLPEEDHKKHADYERKTKV